MNTLIYCPECRRITENGRMVKNVLAHIDINGDIIVKRYSDSVTRIKGREFTIFCDICNEPVFYRKEEDESSSDRQPRVSGFALSVEVGTSWVGSN